MIKTGKILYEFGNITSETSDWIPILKAGYVPAKDKDITIEDLQNILLAFQNKALGNNKEIPVVLTHEGSTAYGWIKDLRLDSDILYALIEWNQNGEAVIKQKEYRYVSPELYYDLKGYDKQEYPVVLFRVALTNTPALDLPPVEIEKQEGKNSALISCSYSESFSYDDKERENLHKQAEKREKQWGIKFKEDGNLTPPSEYAKTGATNPTDYADPVNFKYPIHTEENCKSAFKYFSKAENRDKYSPSEQKIIWERIIRASVKFGYHPSYDPNLHSNLPTEVKKLMDGYEKKEENSMDEELEKYKKLVEEQNQKIEELTAQLEKVTKEKEDYEWDKKINELLENGNILPAMVDELKAIKPESRVEFYEFLSKQKLFNTKTENFEDKVVDKIDEEIKEVKERIHKKLGG